MTLLMFHSIIDAVLGLDLFQSPVQEGSPDGPQCRRHCDGLIWGAFPDETTDVQTLVIVDQGMRQGIFVPPEPDHRDGMGIGINIV